MAYILSFNGINVLGSSINSFANVEFAVGPKAMGGINLVSDVQLVQFLLLFIMQEVDELPIRDRNGQKMRFIPIDGIFSARLYDAIKGFQSSIRDLAGDDGDLAPIVADGVVDPSNTAGISTISGTIYTILWLNAVRQNVTGASMDEDQTSIEPLRSSLRDVRLASDFKPAPDPPNPLPPPPPPPLLR